MSKRTLELSITGRSGTLGTEGEDGTKGRMSQACQLKNSILLALTYISGFGVILETFLFAVLTKQLSNKN